MSNTLDNSSLVPIIAIYPTVIIILVAINRSHMEKGFMNLQANQSTGLNATLPLHRITVTVDTAVTTRCDFGSNGSSDPVLDLGEQKLVPEEGT
ncbi:hypothetical protein GSI_08533 [Ganoderma sinense ZZ0214-1]|uniref:Uncharacterized protein n=1 Tax=Ganoderma sinense ZZ0214-1 TaxID=1077348 RepID=A0A2G8S427_9APHY|nr:hypothetical protein GSI_08533 [Ganoderma sinense ZZ0214-1]